LFQRKRNNVNHYREGRGFATLRTARVNGRVPDVCEGRSRTLTNLHVQELDMCNGELPKECFPERPICDSSDLTDTSSTVSEGDDTSSACTSAQGKIKQNHRDHHHHKSTDG
jgi:hypothetical protein